MNIDSGKDNSNIHSNNNNIPKYEESVEEKSTTQNIKTPTSEPYIPPKPAQNSHNDQKNLFKRKTTPHENATTNKGEQQFTILQKDVTDLKTKCIILDNIPELLIAATTNKPLKHNFPIKVSYVKKKWDSLLKKHTTIKYQLLPKNESTNSIPNEDRKRINMALIKTLTKYKDENQKDITDLKQEIQNKQKQLKEALAQLENNKNFTHPKPVTKTTVHFPLTQKDKTHDTTISENFEAIVDQVNDYEPNETVYRQTTAHNIQDSVSSKDISIDGRLNHIENKNNKMEPQDTHPVKLATELSTKLDTVNDSHSLKTDNSKKEVNVNSPKASLYSQTKENLIPTPIRKTIYSSKIGCSAVNHLLYCKQASQTANQFAQNIGVTYFIEKDQIIFKSQQAENIDKCINYFKEFSRTDMNLSLPKLKKRFVVLNDEMMEYLFINHRDDVYKKADNLKITFDGTNSGYEVVGTNDREVSAFCDYIVGLTGSPRENISVNSTVQQTNLQDQNISDKQNPSPTVPPKEFSRTPFHIPPPAPSRFNNQKIITPSTTQRQPASLNLLKKPSKTNGHDQTTPNLNNDKLSSTTSSASPPIPPHRRPGFSQKPPSAPPQILPQQDRQVLNRQTPPPISDNVNRNKPINTVGSGQNSKIPDVKLRTSENQRNNLKLQTGSIETVLSNEAITGNVGHCLILSGPPLLNPLRIQDDTALKAISDNLKTRTGEKISIQQLIKKQCPNITANETVRIEIPTPNTLNLRFLILTPIDKDNITSSSLSNSYDEVLALIPDKRNLGKLFISPMATGRGKFTNDKPIHIFVDKINKMFTEQQINSVSEVRVICRPSTSLSEKIKQVINSNQKKQSPIPVPRKKNDFAPSNQAIPNNQQVRPEQRTRTDFSKNPPPIYTERAPTFVQSLESRDCKVERCYVNSELKYTGGNVFSSIYDEKHPGGGMNIGSVNAGSSYYGSDGTLPGFVGGGGINHNFHNSLAGANQQTDQYCYFHEERLQNTTGFSCISNPKKSPRYCDLHYIS